MNSTELSVSAPPGDSVTKSKFDLIQIFRGFAAMLVVTYHCNLASLEYFHMLPFKGIFYPGMFGVDFFFVLSGFIITYIHLNDLAKGKNWKLFLKKRFFRIYPIYWVFALITLCYVLLFQEGRPDQYGRGLNPASVSDWIYIIKSFALFPQKPVALVDVSWTLCFEVLFYIVFAVCIRFGWKFAKMIFFTWIILIILKNSGIVKTDLFFVDFALSPLIIEFLMGCVLAYILRTDKIRLTVPLFLSLFTLLLIGAFTYLKIYHHQLGRDAPDLALIISASILIIWASATVEKHRAINTGRLKPLLIIGDGSYSIYLTHTLLVKIFFMLALKLVLIYQLSTTSLMINTIFLLVALFAITAGSLFHLFVERGLLLYLNKTFLPGKRPPAMAAETA